MSLKQEKNKKEGRDWQTAMQGEAGRGKPCQIQRAEGTISGDRDWFILLIRGIIKYIVSLSPLRVVPMTAASACLTESDQPSF